MILSTKFRHTREVGEHSTAKRATRKGGPLVDCGEGRSGCALNALTLPGEEPQSAKGPRGRARPL